MSCHLPGQTEENHEKPVIVCNGHDLNWTIQEYKKEVLPTESIYSVPMMLKIFYMKNVRQVKQKKVAYRSPSYSKK
jgi:hypothetical protein